jgi:hypothetical protein
LINDTVGPRVYKIFLAINGLIAGNVNMPFSSFNHFNLRGKGSKGVETALASAAGTTNKM